MEQFGIRTKKAKVVMNCKALIACLQLETVDADSQVWGWGGIVKKRSWEKEEIFWLYERVCSCLVSDEGEWRGFLWWKVDGWWWDMVTIEEMSLEQKIWWVLKFVMKNGDKWSFEGEMVIIRFEVESSGIRNTIRSSMGLLLKLSFISFLFHSFYFIYLL